jgi:hypothetical protein
MILTDDIKKLYQAYRAQLPVSYRWEDERERWFELFFCTVWEVSGGSPDDVRRAVTALGDLQLLELKDLAECVAGDSVDLSRPPAATLTTLLTANGVQREAAGRAVSAYCLLARRLRERHGKLQLLLRTYGRTLLHELTDMMAASGLESDSKERIATLWLQNALEMPVALSDSYVKRFCDERRCTLDDLIRAADELDINVAAVDDLIRLSYVETDAQA